MHHWFKSYGKLADWVICLLLEFHRTGSAHYATPLVALFSWTPEMREVMRQKKQAFFFVGRPVEGSLSMCTCELARQPPMCQGLVAMDYTGGGKRAILQSAEEPVSLGVPGVQ